jgi:hypothetical protein
MKLVKGDKPGWEALFSDDELYRFVLHRPVPDGARQGMPLTRFLELSKLRDERPPPIGQPMRRLVSCGLNPSTADAFRNDPTVHKETVHAWMWHCTWYTKVNAYAWRETKPHLMFEAKKAGRDIVGADRLGTPPCDNDQAIRSALAMVLRDGGIALAAWGNHVERARVCKLYEIAAEMGVQWMCIGTNKDGSPTHSLYQPYATPLEPWRFR